MCIFSLKHLVQFLKMTAFRCSLTLTDVVLGLSPGRVPVVFQLKTQTKAEQN